MTKTISDKVIIQVIENQQSHQSLRDLAKIAGMSYDGFTHRRRQFINEGKIPGKKAKSYQTPGSILRHSRSEYKEVDTISKKHAAELLNHASQNVDYWKTVASKADRAKSCDDYNDRIGGEL